MSHFRFSIAIPQLQFIDSLVLSALFIDVQLFDLVTIKYPTLRLIVLAFSKSSALHIQDGFC